MQPLSKREYFADASGIVVADDARAEEPPPCNLFYLTNYCKHNDKCVFAHDYLLKPEHLEEMRENAKKSVCPALNRGALLRHAY